LVAARGTRRAIEAASAESLAGAPAGPEQATARLGGRRALFTGLKPIGAEAEMVVYAREAHAIRERAHQEDPQNRLLAWFDRHLK
jgi:hypothetical protein